MRVPCTASRCSPYCFQCSITLLANSYPLAKCYWQAFFSLLLFPGDSPQPTAEIPIFSSYIHYPILSCCISYFMLYCDLMATPFVSSYHQITHQSALAVLASSHQQPQLADSSLWPSLSNCCSPKNFTSSVHLAWWFFSTIHLIVSSLACALMYWHSCTNLHPLQLN